MLDGGRNSGSGTCEAMVDGSTSRSWCRVKCDSLAPSDGSLLILFIEVEMESHDMWELIRFGLCDDPTDVDRGRRELLESALSRSPFCSSLTFRDSLSSSSLRVLTLVLAAVGFDDPWGFFLCTTTWPSICFLKREYLILAA